MTSTNSRRALISLKRKDSSLTAPYGLSQVSEKKVSFSYALAQKLFKVHGLIRLCLLQELSLTTIEKLTAKLTLAKLTKAGLIYSDKISR